MNNMNRYIAPAIITTSLLTAPLSAAESFPSVHVDPIDKSQENHPAEDGNRPDIHVEWDGTVFEATPDPGRYDSANGYGYINLHPIGMITSQALKGFIDWEKSFYPDETLENGAIIFKQGNVEGCEARVTREGGDAWSFPAASGEGVPEEYCQDIGHLALPQ